MSNPDDRDTPFHPDNRDAPFHPKFNHSLFYDLIDFVF